MKNLITLTVLGLLGAAILGCEGRVFDRDKDVYEKKTVVRYDNGDRTVKTTTVEKQ